MRKIDFLPKNKQEELDIIVQTIRHYSEVALIILFGSYARGTWVEEYAEDGAHFQYQSDYDLLVVVKTRNTFAQHRLENEIISTVESIPEIQTPVSPIVHDVEFLNCRLEKAQYFFSDIKKQGIVLYDSGEIKLRKPRELSQKERYNLAKEDFEYWFSKAKKFYSGYKFYLSEKDYSEAAFLLHQTAERLYTTILLVFTRYKPNTHDLSILRRLTNALDSRLLKIFSHGNSEEKYRFLLLRNAYVDARYKRTYTITEEELIWLADRIKILQEATEILCNEKMDSFLTTK